VLAFASACGADEITTVESTTTMPTGSSVTVRQTTEGNPADAVELGRRTLIVPTGPIASRESTSSVTETKGLGNPKYIKRVSALRDQVNDAVSKGWLTDADAAPYRSMLDDLSAKAGALDSSDASSNSLEKQINEVNIDLSNKLAKH
jgi:hypothetical protein